MNDLAFPRRVALPFASEPVAAGVGPEEIRLGMPHLSGCGLSESWLLKELGHRHWTMLAGAAGREAPDFRDEEGRPVYAAFLALRLAGARLDLGGENGRLAVRSELRRLSRTQVESRHALLLDGVPAGAVELVSAFVRRTGASNHAVARVALDGPMPVDPAPSELAGLAAEQRAGRLARHLGLDLSAPRADGPAATFDPCPAQDFNGAGFLYFPSFLAFVDRAEWRLARDPAPLARREAFFRANLDPGVAIRVALAAERPESRTRWWRVERADDGTVLADVFTQRRAAAEPSPGR